MGAMNKHICEMTTIIGPECRERFLPFLDGGPLVGAGLCLAGLSRLRRQYRIARPNPTFHLILGVLDGHARLITPTEQRELRPGDLLIAPAGGGAYAYELIRGRSWAIVWCHVSAAAGRDWLRDVPQLTVRRSPDLPKLAAEVEDLLAEAARNLHLATEARRAKELYLLVLLERFVRFDRHPTEPHEHDDLDRLFAAASADLAQPWTLGQLAERAGYSPTHLNRLCRAHFGRSAMRHLTFLRMEHAGRLLRRERLKIRTVAWRCGYGDEFAFSVAFKRHFGVSPRQMKSQ